MYVQTYIYVDLVDVSNMGPGLDFEATLTSLATL